MPAMAQPSEREFALTDANFAELARLVRSQTGIVLGDHKREMVYSRLARRLRALKLGSFTEYCELLNGPAGTAEIGFTINAITTNLTRFFREPHHFKHLKEHVLQSAATRWDRGERASLRIWSAGCSSGEEPYTIAMMMASTVRDAGRRDARILATDLDTNMLETGKAGCYRAELVEQIPGELRKRFVQRDPEQPGMVRMAEELRRLVAFRRLNLLHEWPIRRRYAAIFCRNVMIYFDAATKRDLVRRYVDLLEPGGILYLGHSESLLGDDGRLRAVGSTTYQKVG